jgi:hypothetical protein
MKQRKGLIPIPIPTAVRNPYRIGRFSREVRKAITALASRQDKVFGRRSTSGSIIPPFWPSLKEMEGEEGATFAVTVTEGLVVERDVRNVENGDSVILHEPDNHREEDDELKEFPVEAGDSIFVVVEVTKTGAIGITPEDPPEDPEPPAVTLKVMPTDTASTHYEPEIGDDNEGAAGTYYYPLADFVAGDEEGSLEMIQRMAGQHIDHWQELPTFENAGGETIWKEWDAEAGVYKTKGITGVSPIVITGNADDVQVSLESEGANFNVQLLDCAVSIDGSTNDVTITTQSGPRMWYVRGGMIGLVDDEEDVDTYQIISRISGSGASASGPGFTPAPE